MDKSKQAYTNASIKTAVNLKTMAHSIAFREVSNLSLPEIDAVIDLIAHMIPAGNVPGVILSGLARLPGTKPPLKTVARDINLLFKGVEQVLDRAVYGAFFAGPAAVIWGYQNLLKLAGKDPEDSFPEGTWQFYIDYALREDTARHTNETHGFDTLLNQHQIRLDTVDRITAWVMAVIYGYHQYDALLENEWRERIILHLLSEITRERSDAGSYALLYREWEKQRPYGRGPDSPPRDTYPAYRRSKFDRFVEQATHSLPAALRRQWLEQIRAAEKEDLPAYQRQMSILATLDPGLYGETRTPIALAEAQVGIIYRGNYTLIPACAAGTNRPADVSTVRAQVAGLVSGTSGSSETSSLLSLVGVKRATQADLRTKLSKEFMAELSRLRLAPILLNWDRRSRRLPLSDLRQAERGVGDHALTVFDTGETFVFDQSHIFFDGTWGAALSEILTNEALAWAVYLHSLPSGQLGGADLRPLALSLRPSELKQIEQAPRVTPEVSAESEAVDLHAILALRKLLHSRNDRLRLTVNDILVLYRAIHAATYQPAPDLTAELKHPRRTEREAFKAVSEAIHPSEQSGVAILIPVDASLCSPRDRLYPMTFEVPLKELDLLQLHNRVLTALDRYKNATGDRADLYAEFNRLQRRYLSTLAGFGTVLGRAREIAARGESTSVGTIKLLAHLPKPLQRLLDQVPSHFEMLNDLIKGREVFSNVGAVVPTSTLTRFITAKDDNDKKTLAWGVITDAKGRMHVSLRDFRPHVGLLEQIGRRDLAVRIVEDYLNAYAHGLNVFIGDLQKIAVASRKTRRKSDKIET